MTDAGGTHIVSCSQELLIIQKKGLVVKDTCILYILYNTKFILWIIWFKGQVFRGGIGISSQIIIVLSILICELTFYILFYKVWNVASPCFNSSPQQRNQTLALHVFSIHSMARWHEGCSVGCKLQPHTRCHYMLHTGPSRSLMSSSKKIAL